MDNTNPENNASKIFFEPGTEPITQANIQTDKKTHNPVLEHLSTRPSDKELRFFSRILSIIIIICSCLLLLAIVSFTIRDESNIQVYLNDLFFMFSSSTEDNEKFNSIYNLLGVNGAIIADYLINYTIGI